MGKDTIARPHCNGLESSGAQWLGGDASVEKPTGDEAHSDHRSFCPCRGKQPRESTRCRLRCLSNEADRFCAAGGENSIPPRPGRHAAVSRFEMTCSTPE